jgi:hypothetical protein
MSGTCIIEKCYVVSLHKNTAYSNYLTESGASGFNLMHSVLLND